MVIPVTERPQVRPHPAPLHTHTPNILIFRHHSFDLGIGRVDFEERLVDFECAPRCEWIVKQDQTLSEEEILFGNKLARIVIY